jgi:hypothetical protein
LLSSSHRSDRRLGTAFIDPAGPRLLDEVPDRVEMELLEAAPTSSGSVWLRYALTETGRG